MPHVSLCPPCHRSLMRRILYTTRLYAKYASSTLSNLVRQGTAHCPFSASRSFTGKEELPFMPQHCCIHQLATETLDPPDRKLAFSHPNVMPYVTVVCNPPTFRFPLLSVSAPLPHAVICALSHALVLAGGVLPRIDVLLLLLYGGPTARRVGVHDGHRLARSIQLLLA